jgi:hypothetical protein
MILVDATVGLFVAHRARWLFYVKSRLLPRTPEDAADVTLEQFKLRGFSPRSTPS